MHNFQKFIIFIAFYYITYHNGDYCYSVNSVSVVQFIGIVCPVEFAKNERAVYMEEEHCGAIGVPEGKSRQS